MKDSKNINDTKDEKKLQKLISTYNLDKLTEDDIEILKTISLLVSENAWYKNSFTSTFSDPEKRVHAGYLETLIEQNWLVIKQLNSLNSKLDTLLEK